MRVLITGGAGFIGSHLCDALIAGGHAVTVLDDLSSGNTIAPGAKLIQGDVCDEKTVSEALEGQQACFHLAAVASVEVAERDWRRSHAVNLGGTLEILRGCAARGVPVVYASSAAVYGNNLSLPLTESMAAQPVSAYGTDKLACEQHAHALAHHSGLRAVGLRFFNVYGARQSPASSYSGVISRFGERLLSGETLTINGDGEQTRDFIHVSDVVHALRLALEWPLADRSAGGAFNICTGKSVSVNALAALMSAVAGKQMNVRHGVPRAGDARHSLGCPLKARRVLNFAAASPLEAGLSETLAWLAGA